MINLTRQFGIALVLGFIICSPVGAQSPCATSLSQADVDVLVAEASPNTRQKMRDPAYRKKQYDQLRDLFALTCQAVRDGLAAEPDTARFLNHLQVLVTARAFDQEMYKNDGATGFEWISDARIEEFYRDKQNAAEFESHRAMVMRVLGASGADETKLRRDFAVETIAFREARARAAELSAEFTERLASTIRLMQAQHLAGVYSQRVLNPKKEVSEAEIDEYIAARPIYSGTTKKALAERILKRALAGESFAALARTYSQDPGSKQAGGLYQNVAPGVFVPELEAAALALEPGQIAGQVVATPFGFHIIKLEKKGEAADANGTPKPTYDVRHILISTMVRDPKTPGGRDVPVRDFVRTTLEDEREKAARDAVRAANPIVIAGEAPAAPTPATKPRSRIRRN
jgi:hypothetical protein